ncbi:hypothetical protein HCN44_006077 [Aphidius gifuensis]|uniref:XK-related protein n=1 Tax=Aphidius gifuensis TaxID=684658 RepID=A0A834Y3S5_APHGI|nr:uncharacterized protein LOC122851613 [Aphidius gifuensis]KAF7997506.1 hypothetical protein HCN44_006077 [Aphidius gifuensis]
MAQHQQINHQHEFLPLCDVLFNIISLGSYFCDVVFDLAMSYSLANLPTAPTTLFPISILLIITSLVISQIVSLRWYLWGPRGKLNNQLNHETNINPNDKKNYSNWKIWFVVFLHSTQIGVLWRYFKLFIPVDLTYVKHEVRELCVLRLIHGFCEAAPMLLLQLYLLSIGIDDNELIKDDKQDNLSSVYNINELYKLTILSACLSLWSVCWAVASFSKGAARLRNLERLVLTWLGVLAQLAWRLGTVSARVGALVAYASLYGGKWLIIVMALHWLSMLTWLLLTPDGLFNGNEKLSIKKKTFLASLLAFIYVFSYVNLHETNHRQKMIIFYTVMFLENSLLIGIWAVGVNSNSDIQLFQNQPKPILLVLILLGLFFGGICFMGLYYRFFHVRRWRYEAGGRMNITNAVTTFSNNENNDDKHNNNNTTNNNHKKINNGCSISMRKVKVNNNGIPGVFNCRFANPTVVNPNRKKKKPTTFVPPPPPPTQQTTTTLLSSSSTTSQQHHHHHHQADDAVVGSGCNDNTKPWLNCNNTKQTTPFWKRPLSIVDNIDNQSIDIDDNYDLSISSLNINLIHEKLREKKQQQLRELRKIEEEIKQGKLVPPSASTSSFSSSLSATNQQQQPPNTKLHNTTNSDLSIAKVNLTNIYNIDNTKISWPPIKMHCLNSNITTSSCHNNNNNYSTNIFKGLNKHEHEQSDNQEILLEPRCLPHHYPHWTSELEESCNNAEDDSSKGELVEVEGEISDMEGSQVSLPKSYTLLREFQYDNSNNTSRERRCITNKTQSSHFYLPSTNSSDGDVDSADNEEETDYELQDNIKQLNNLSNDDNLTKRLTILHSDDSNNLNIDNDKSSDCYLNNSYVPRVNQILKSKVKHETKL